jgi:hypothetical protein
MIVFWDIASCSLVETGRRFGGVHVDHFLPDYTTQFLKNSHTHTFRREKLKSYLLSKRLTILTVEVCTFLNFYGTSISLMEKRYTHWQEEVKLWKYFLRNISYFRYMQSNKIRKSRSTKELERNALQFSHEYYRDKLHLGFYFDYTLCRFIQKMFS